MVYRLWGSWNDSFFHPMPFKRNDTSIIRTGWTEGYPLSNYKQVSFLSPVLLDSLFLILPFKGTSADSPPSLWEGEGGTCMHGPLFSFVLHFSFMYSYMVPCSAWEKSLLLTTVDCFLLHQSCYWYFQKNKREDCISPPAGQVIVGEG